MRKLDINTTEYEKNLSKNVETFIERMKDIKEVYHKDSGAKLALLFSKSPGEYSESNVVVEINYHDINSSIVETTKHSDLESPLIKFNGLYNWNVSDIFRWDKSLSKQIYLIPPKGMGNNLDVLDEASRSQYRQVLDYLFRMTFSLEESKAEYDDPMGMLLDRLPVVSEYRSVIDTEESDTLNDCKVPDKNRKYNILDKIIHDYISMILMIIDVYGSDDESTKNFNDLIDRNIREFIGIRRESKYMGALNSKNDISYYHSQNNYFFKSHFQKMIEVIRYMDSGRKTNDLLGLGKDVMELIHVESDQTNNIFRQNNVPYGPNRISGTDVVIQYINNDYIILRYLQSIKDGKFRLKHLIEMYTYYHIKNIMETPIIKEFEERLLNQNGNRDLFNIILKLRDEVMEHYDTDNVIHDVSWMGNEDLRTDSEMESSIIDMINYNYVKEVTTLPIFSEDVDIPESAYEMKEEYLERFPEQSAKKDCMIREFIYYEEILKSMRLSNHNPEDMLNKIIWEVMPMMIEETKLSYNELNVVSQIFHSINVSKEMDLRTFKDRLYMIGITPREMSNESIQRIARYLNSMLKILNQYKILQSYRDEHPISSYNDINSVYYREILKDENTDYELRNMSFYQKYIMAGGKTSDLIGGFIKGIRSPKLRNTDPNYMIELSIDYPNSDILIPSREWIEDMTTIYKLLINTSNILSDLEDWDPEFSENDKRDRIILSSNSYTPLLNPVYLINGYIVKIKVPENPFSELKLIIKLIAKRFHKSYNEISEEELIKMLTPEVVSSNMFTSREIEDDMIKHMM